MTFHFPLNVEPVVLSEQIPIIPWGAGTSLEGHILAVRGGITLDFSMMDKILSVNERDMDVTVSTNKKVKTSLSG